MRLTVLLVLAVVVSSMGQQDSVRLDSGSHTHKVPALNGMPQTPMTEATFAAVPLITKDSYRYNQGLSVFNSFRGQVPGMIISPGTQVDTMTWRFNTPVMVVDGIPFKLLPGQVNNLNAFDVESATAILGPNASLPFGGSGSRGALILKSKTGEGFAKPTFEANSYTTYSYGSEDYSGHQWLLSNSLAYGQDFGVVDVRVSGNYQMQPESSNMSKGPDGYGLRINTGLNLGRLSARLILNSNRMDGFQAYYTDFTMSPPISPIPIPPQPSTPERVREALQGNLMLKYQLTDWLNISGQGMLASMINKNNSGYTLFTTTSDGAFGNILLNANPRLSRSFSLTATVGMLMYKQGFKRSGVSFTSGSMLNQYAEGNTNAGLLSAEVAFRNVLFVGGTYRRDFINVAHVDGISPAAFAMSAGYIFNKLLDRSEQILSHAKIRVNAGFNDVTQHYLYPSVSSIYGLFPNNEPTDAKEIGLDLSFLKNKISFSTTYFINQFLASPQPSILDPVTGYTVTYYSLSFGDSRTKGIEFIVRANLNQAGKVPITTQVAFTNLQHEVDVNGNPFVGNLNPDWLLSWRTQVSVRRFFFSVLIDTQQGGSHFSYEPGTLGWFDASFVKLREGVVGYRFGLGRIKMESAIILRNAWTIQSASNTDIEGVGLNSTRPRSTSISISAIF